jgi:hypothetical protein
MSGNAARFLRYSAGIIGLVTAGWVLTSQAADPPQHGVPLPNDWSHRHVIFSRPATGERRRSVKQDPRYLLQLHRNDQRLMPSATTAKSGGSNALIAAQEQIHKRRRKVHRDWTVDLGTGGSVGAGNFPAKFSFDSKTASCANDYVVFSTGLPGAVNQATIVGFGNLYLGCGGTVPSTSWAYDTSQLGVPATVRTSPALALDGSQIAFVQRNAAAASQLVLLKWSTDGGQVTLPTRPAHVVPAVYRTCTAPCMTSFNLTDLGNLLNDDTTSSVFIDYSGDTAWVGDKGGTLHQFTGVFKGTPAEIRDGTWPVTLSSQPLSSPVFDHVSGNVFVGDLGGFLYRVDLAGTAIPSGRLDFGPGIVAGPVVDSAKGTVYVSASGDGSLSSVVYQLSTAFIAGNAGTKVVVGASSSLPQPMYDGFFDSSYLDSLDGTGNYYVCGNTGFTPTLYQVPIVAGVFGTPVDVSILSRTTNVPCSPVTDFANPNTNLGTAERVFVSVTGDAWPTPCNSVGSGGCVMNFVVTPWQPVTVYSIGQQVLVHSKGNPNVLFIQTVIHAGTSGSTTPDWASAPDVATSDPPGFDPTSVGWLNQGRIDATPFAIWQPNFTPPFVGDRILDSNGNIELVDSLGTTGATVPTWPLFAGQSVADGTLTWRNAGAAPTVPFPVSGGTSGIIIDNSFDIGVLAGTSQVYFTTLADQNCGASGTGGCAVQASQPGLN